MLLRSNNCFAMSLFLNANGYSENIFPDSCSQSRSHMLLYRQTSSEESEEEEEEEETGMGVSNPELAAYLRQAKKGGSTGAGVL